MMFEEVCGARLTYSYLTIGGATHDLPQGWLQQCEKFLDERDDLSLVRLERRIDGVEILKEILERGFHTRCGKRRSKSSAGMRPRRSEMARE